MSFLIVKIKTLYIFMLGCQNYYNLPWDNSLEFVLGSYPNPRCHIVCSPFRWLRPTASRSHYRLSASSFTIDGYKMWYNFSFPHFILANSG